MAVKTLQSFGSKLPLWENQRELFNRKLPPNTSFFPRRRVLTFACRSSARNRSLLNQKMPEKGVIPMHSTHRIAVICFARYVFSAVAIPEWVFAQSSPFLTGATSLQTNILAWATPIAVIVVMALGIAAMANRISWGWPIAAIVGIAVIFGAPQIVTWVRGMFGV